jgi:hypothetical protein
MRMQNSVKNKKNYPFKVLCSERVFYFSTQLIKYFYILQETKPNQDEIYFKIVNVVIPNDEHDL